MAIVAGVVTVGALYLAPTEAPLKLGGETMMAMMEQTRAKAIGTTRVHRAAAADEPVVEQADSCSAVARTYDPTIELHLPPQLTLAAANWWACFDRRGLSSENLVFVLNRAR